MFSISNAIFEISDLATQIFTSGYEIYTGISQRSRKLRISIISRIITPKAIPLSILYQSRPLGHFRISSLWTGRWLLWKQLHNFERPRVTKYVLVYDLSTVRVRRDWQSYFVAICNKENTKIPPIASREIQKFLPENGLIIIEAA